MTLQQIELQRREEERAKKRRYGEDRVSIRTVRGGIPGLGRRR